MSGNKRKLESSESEVREPKRKWPPFPDSTRSEDKDRPVQRVLPQRRQPDPEGLDEPTQGRDHPPLWQMHEVEGMREWTEYAKMHLIMMRVRMWSRYRLAEMFCRMIPPDRHRPPPVWITQDLPQDHFTFDFDDLRNVSDSEPDTE